MIDMPLVHETADADGVLSLTLNRPAARNALSQALMTALADALTRIAATPGIRVVILAGAGPVFCAGHDLKEMRASPHEAAQRALFTQCSALMQQIVHLPQPVIAEVQGIATAAGCQLVASCDLALAGHTTRFATPGVDIGLFCSTPMVALSRAVGRKAAMAMLLTGDFIDAETAVRIGLINAHVPDPDLHDHTLALARKIARKSPAALTIGKRAFYRQIDLNLADAYALASETMTRNMMEQDAAIGIDAFLAKRPPIWHDAGHSEEQ